MNADDRANPSSPSVFAPVNDDAEQQAAPVSGAVPTAGNAPITGSVPRRSSVRPPASAQYATGQPAATTSQPVTGVHPITGTHPVTGANPLPTAQQTTPGGSFSAGAAGAVGAGMGKLKDYANKAKESLTEGDDVTASRAKGGPRKARVLLSRIDPWSALKMGFLLSVAIGIMMVVAVFVLWSMLNQMGVFVMINDWIVKLFTTGEVDLLQFTSLRKVMSATILLSIINVVLLSALTTIGAFLYNIVSSVVGGVYVTLTDD
ncbi:DUF3566 domain-containing protein [Demequina aurantiaca]|uniref:DUF3566 domain-containing protein n=1 Tax=Demequina aurantiaca TaxID=676200 RepID=UPI003D3303E5